MASTHTSPAVKSDVVDETPYDDYTPTFFVGQHESRRSLPVSEFVLRQAQDVGYDMLTTPITTPHFHSRVLALLSSHLSESDHKTNPPAPIIPPFMSVDTPLAPGDTLSSLIGYASPWIDLCSPDPLIANISRQVLTMEVAYAAFCGIGNLIIPGPRQYDTSRDTADGLTQFARATKEALNVGSYVQMAVLLPMYNVSGVTTNGAVGALAPFAREEYFRNEAGQEASSSNLFETWDAWNLIRSICKYNSRLSVGKKNQTINTSTFSDCSFMFRDNAIPSSCDPSEDLFSSLKVYFPALGLNSKTATDISLAALSLPRQLPAESLQSRWFAEPLRILSFTPSTFLKNKGGYPVLSKSHQALISRYMRLKQSPWLLLSDVGPIPGLDDPNLLIPTADGFPSPSAVADASGSPTPAEAAESLQKESVKSKIKSKDLASHLSYIRWLQRHQPPRTIIERFGVGYQDFLQAPLQPLTDNLESVTYEVFEKDPVKYDWYEAAIEQALRDWASQSKPTSSPTGAVVVAVAGSGRGPLVTRALRASAKTGIAIEAWAVEKNPNAYVILQRHNEEDWNGVVNIVKSDMRAWKGPVRSTHTVDPMSSILQPTEYSYGKVDILVSELLGSFADNELSPECLDGVQHVLAPTYGISIPSSYTAHMTPILAPRLHADISHRSASDSSATDTPYVVMLHQIDFVATEKPECPRIQEVWEFKHPLPPNTLAIAEARRGGGVSGGGGGSMAGGDGANEHNARYARRTFFCRDRGVVHGIAGYFEAVLYDGGSKEKLVELSTRPDAIDAKSKDMISWFPIYFPLKNPLYFPDDAELEISIWRQTDDRKVWYEWLVEAFMMIGMNKRVRVGLSETGSSRKAGCLM